MRVFGILVALGVGVVFSSIETFMKISVEDFERFLENFFENSLSVDDSLLYFFLKKLNRDWKASYHYSDFVPWYESVKSFPSETSIGSGSSGLFNGLDYIETEMLKECIRNSTTFREMIREFDQLMQL